MATPLTLDGIRPYISTTAFDTLKSKNVNLGNFTQPGGICVSEEPPNRHEINRVYHDYNVYLGWNYDETNAINGIFLRVYSHACMSMYKFTENSIKSLQIHNDRVLFIQETSSASSLEDILTLKRADPSLEIRPLIHVKPKDQQKVTNWCSSSPEMLSDELRIALFAPQEPNQIPDQISCDLRYIGGSILAILVIACLVKKYFTKPQNTPR